VLSPPNTERFLPLFFSLPFGTAQRRLACTLFPPLLGSLSHHSLPPNWDSRSFRRESLSLRPKPRTFLTSPPPRLFVCSGRLFPRVFFYATFSPKQTSGERHRSRSRYRVHPFPYSGTTCRTAPPRVIRYVLRFLHFLTF